MNASTRTLLRLTASSHPPPRSIGFIKATSGPWVLTWGATPSEAAAPLPGDGLLEIADVVATRAIEISAPPSAIWPWLVQMGPGRAGAYTYDWIENLFGLNMHSADRIQPEWQELEVGDVLRSREGRPGMRVEILEPERFYRAALRPATGSGPSRLCPKTARPA